MAYFKYHAPTCVWESPVSRACHNAVTWPLAKILYSIYRRAYPDAKNPTPEPTTLPLAMDLVHSRWTARPAELTEAGWPVALKAGVAAGNKAGPPDSDVFATARNNAVGKRLTYIANCPPYGALFPVMGQFCNHTRICPGCYCRRVVAPIYAALVWAFQGAGKEKTKDCSLLVVRRQYIGVPGQGLYPPLVELCQRMESSRYTVIKSIKLPQLGSIVLGMLVPDRKTKPGSVVSDRTSMLIVKGTVRENHPALGGLAAKLKAGELTTMAAVPAAEVTLPFIDGLLGSVTPYPVAALLGDPKLMAQILVSIPPRQHMLVCSGVLRNRRFRDGGKDAPVDPTENLQAVSVEESRRLQTDPACYV